VQQPEFPYSGKQNKRQADVAQLVEQLIRNQQVTGSSPVVGSSTYRVQGQQSPAVGSCAELHFIRMNNLCHAFSGLK
jgi:hypothetical protein